MVKICLKNKRDPNHIIRARKGPGVNSGIVVVKRVTGEFGSSLQIVTVRSLSDGADPPPATCVLKKKTQ